MSQKNEKKMRKAARFEIERDTAARFFFIIEAATQLPLRMRIHIAWVVLKGKRKVLAYILLFIILGLVATTGYYGPKIADTLQGQWSKETENGRQP